MTLVPGTRLGGYEVVALLGIGGMGEVYRARDTKLKRDVAIKVLPDEFSKDADRLARFRREAEVLATLNHPNIAAVYGLEETDGVTAIVMELVEGATLGETLSAHGSGLKAQAIPFADTVSIARQIVDALEAAHEKGVVHRDLKPGNIKVTPEGQVKVLDFGLAKLSDPVASNATAMNTQSPTLSLQATRAGLILGTAAYMSPEQARGKTVDKRTDIWAFGCVLYEMLTGQRAFGGEEISDTLAFVITKEPVWTALPPSTPSSTRKLLRRCLEKDRKKRLADVADVRFDLDEGTVVESDVRPDLRAGPATKKYASLYGWMTAAVLLLTTLVLAGAMYLRRVPPSTGTLRTSILLPANVTISAAAASRFALSPDGRMLAFAARESTNVLAIQNHIWVRPIDSLTARPLRGTDGGVYPSWSPDGRSVAFVAQGKLKRVDIADGSLITLSDRALSAPLAWNGDNVIVFTPAAGSPLFRVSASGGPATAVTTLDAEQGDYDHRSPFFLPDGRHFLYLVLGSKAGGTNDPRAVYVASLDQSEKSRLVLEKGSNAKYAQGYLLFMRDATLMAQPFDAENVRLTGEASPLVDQLAVSSIGVSAALGAFSVSDNGLLVYQSATGEVRSQLAWFDRTGKELNKIGEPGDYLSVELAPDETRVAVSVLESSGRSRDLWLFDLRRGFRTQFTFGPGDEAYPVWSPDGGWVAFSLQRDGRGSLYQKMSNGQGEEQTLLVDELNKLPYSWSPDGKLISYNSTNSTPKTGQDTWLLPLSGERKPVSFLQTPANEGQGRISRDGRWMAYVSNESGPVEVWVTSFPQSAGKWRVSTMGGTWPRWRKDGTELFFLGPDNRLMAVAVNGQGSAFEFGPARPLFQTRARTSGPGSGGYSSYDVSADGQKFLVNSLVEDAAPVPMTLVVNWSAALKK